LRQGLQVGEGELEFDVGELANRAQHSPRTMVCLEQ